MLDHFSTVVYKPVPVHASAPKCSSSMIKVIGSLWSYWRGLLRPYHSSKRKRRYVEPFIFGSTKYGPTPKPKKKTKHLSIKRWNQKFPCHDRSPIDIIWLTYSILHQIWNTVIWDDSPSYTIAITSVTSPSLSRSTCRSKSDAQLRWDKSPRCSCGTERLKMDWNWRIIGVIWGLKMIPCDTQSLYHFMPFGWLKHVETDDKESNIIKFWCFSWQTHASCGGLMGYALSLDEPP